MNLYTCDLHVHIGRSGSGRPVKITAARDLTFTNIAVECAERKGIDIVGIVDCASPAVMEDIAQLLQAEQMVPHSGGGLRYRQQVTVILGAEFETKEPDGGISHHISYFPDFPQLQEFSAQMAQHVTNLQLSSQACQMPARELMQICRDCGGMFIPAHCFTPHKSAYGACTRRLADMFGELWDQVPAIELGLSADSYLADHIGELSAKSFLSNSDAHSLPRIAREYNIVEMAGPTFEELSKCLRSEEGRSIRANFGLDPRLGKYHRTYCNSCERIAQGEPPMTSCEHCGSSDIVMGVLDRIVQIQDYPEPHPPDHRPPYQYQVPLLFVPGVGPVSLRRLINNFGSEMAVLHEADEQQLGLVVGSKIARLIVLAREGRLPLQPGGGGIYGKAMTEDVSQMSIPGV